MAINPVVSFNSGGSGTGISYYKMAGTCPRRAEYSKKLAESSNPEATYKLDVGTVFHKFCEIYHGGEDVSRIIIEASDISRNEALQEGRRLFTEYSRRYSRDVFGRVINTEFGLPCNHSTDCNMLSKKESEICNCKRKEQEEKLLNTFGVAFTAKIDMVVSIEDIETQSRVSNLVGERIEQGIYLVDHKTTSSGKQGTKSFGTLCQKFLYEPQFKAYMLAYSILFPNNPLKGLLVNIVGKAVKIEDEHFNQILIPFPTSLQIEEIKDFLKWSEKRTYLDGKNLAACFDNYCPYVSRCRA
jgi:hypothetical protein